MQYNLSYNLSLVHGLTRHARDSQLHDCTLQCGTVLTRHQIKANDAQQEKVKGRIIVLQHDGCVVVLVGINSSCSSKGSLFRVTGRQKKQ
jgi:hypothetical protein